MSKHPLTLLVASAALAMTLSACNRADSPGSVSQDASPAQYDGAGSTTDMRPEDTAQPASTFEAGEPGGVIVDPVAPAEAFPEAPLAEDDPQPLLID